MLRNYFDSFTNQWFFEPPKSFLRYLLVYIKGDTIVLLPFAVVVLLFGFVSIDFMLVLIGLFIAFRGLGEMMFWILQQFGPRTYRPNDFGFTQLDNNAIYIIYQLLGMVSAISGTALVIMLLFF